MKKIVLAALIGFLPLLSHADQTLEDVLASCASEYTEVLVDAKMDFLRSSPWNYDNDYDLSQVSSGEAYDFQSGSFKVDVFFSVDELKPYSYTYIFEPHFVGGDKSQCDYVRLDGPIIN